MLHMKVRPVKLRNPDVLASIKSISSLVKNPKARKKIVLIVLDMLENSSVPSFYTDRGLSVVRKIEPAKEIKLIDENQLLGDFSVARFYIIGAGNLADDTKQTKSYRDPKNDAGIDIFLEGISETINAQLIEFRKPALLNPLRYVSMIGYQTIQKETQLCACYDITDTR